MQLKTASNVIDEFYNDAPENVKLLQDAYQVASKLAAMNLRQYQTIEHSCNWCDFYHVYDFMADHGHEKSAPSFENRRTLVGLLRDPVLACRPVSLEYVYKAIFADKITTHHRADVDTRKLFEVTRFVGSG